MRLTSKLYAQHLGWMFKKHWQIQGKRTPRSTGAIEELNRLGISVKDIKDVVAEPKKFEKIEIAGSKLSGVVEDESHPNWHDEICFVYDNSNVLIEGMPQALLLTKSVEINKFPNNIEESISKFSVPNAVDNNVHDLIKASHIFDAEQVKLPKVKLPDRPAYNLPRAFGISSDRRSRLLVNKLIFECEKLAGRSATSRRKCIDNVDCKVTLAKDNNLVQLSINAEKLITSVRPLNAVKGTYDGELPDLYPLKCTISIPKKHVYTTNSFFPLSKDLAYSHLHTVFSHFNKEFVMNLHESQVTTNQFQSRTLLKAFGFAAARAKQLYGDSVDKLPKPILVQSIQTDGRSFHFGVFQLNTLLISGTDGIKNYWFHQPSMDLFTECDYRLGRPSLDGYNKDVFRCILAFYNNF